MTSAYSHKWKEVCTIYSSTRYYQLRQAIDSALEAFSHLSLQLDNAIMAAEANNKNKNKDLGDLRMPTRNNLLVGNLQNKSFIIAKPCCGMHCWHLRALLKIIRQSSFTGQYILCFSGLSSGKNPNIYFITIWKFEKASYVFTFSNNLLHISPILGWPAWLEAFNANFDVVLTLITYSLHAILIRKNLIRKSISNRKNNLHV